MQILYKQKSIEWQTIHKFQGRKTDWSQSHVEYDDLMDTIIHLDSDINII